MKKLLVLVAGVMLVSCKTSYETITYIEVRGENLTKKEVVVDSRFTHSVEEMRRVAGLKGDKWIIDKIEKYDKDSHLINNEKQGRYPKK